METLRFDTSKKHGAFKPLNATNGGPWHKRHAHDQWRSNFEEYKAARIPYSRNHDSNIVNSIYGGPYAHDISAIFPNFDADVNDPDSYDFACTDEAIMVSLDAGTETYFRLGQSIEHQIIKHATKPPKDFHKWAEICEHIIRHYNYGWANGYELGIKYWEIWNEPDLYEDDPTNKPTWGGTREQFFDFFEIAAKHLSACFPELKIGGPAICGNEEWGEHFLSEMQKRNVPLDFFSWHIYCREPESAIEMSERVRKTMDKYGYGDAESILNEWNYVEGWSDERFVYTIEMIHGIKGASFVLAMMCLAQPSTIDMLMYYDTRPSGFCGAFDMYTYRPLPGYYPLYWYGMFYDMESEVRCETSAEHIYSLCGVDKNGKTLTMLTHYENNDSAEPRKVKLDFGRKGNYEVYLVDKTHNGEKIDHDGSLEFTLPVYGCLLVKEI